MYCLCQNNRCAGEVTNSKVSSFDFPLCVWHRSCLPQIGETFKSLKKLRKLLIRHDMDLDIEEQIEELGSPICTSCTNSTFFYCPNCNGPICKKCDFYGQKICCMIRGR